MEHFSLAPGRGGDDAHGSYYTYGGGAGGVLVNGEGPTRPFAPNDGEGYGAGGWWQGHGLPGVILIEVGP